VDEGRSTAEGHVDVPGLDGSEHRRARKELHETRLETGLLEQLLVPSQEELEKRSRLPPDLDLVLGRGDCWRVRQLNEYQENRGD
jgi:hypothetical protein